MKAQLQVDLNMVLGEGPVWDPVRRCVWWVDIGRHKLHSMEWDSGAVSTESLPGAPGSLAIADDGDLLIAAANGLWERSADGAVERVHHHMAPGQRWNDGKADSAGRFIVGTTSAGAESIDNGAALWSFDGGKASLLLANVTISNGLAWTPDARGMLYVDTPTHRIDEFDYDLEAGLISGRRTYAVVDAELGAPDGLAMDAEGGVWVAVWGAGCVLRILDGKIDHRIDIDCPFATCPVFAGDGLAYLVITSAWSGGTGTGDGGLYIAEPGVCGIVAPDVSWSRVAGAE